MLWISRHQPSSRLQLSDLPAETRLMIYRYIRLNGTAALRNASLVCKEWFQEFFPLVNKELRLEAYRFNPEGSIVPPSIGNDCSFSILRDKLMGMENIRATARSLVLTGPSATRHWKMTAKGVALRAPRLSLCLCASILQLLPHVDHLHLHEVDWEPCDPAQGDPHDAHKTWARRRIVKMELSIVKCIEPAVSHPLLLATLCTSIGELCLDAVEGIDLAGSMHLPPIAIDHLAILQSLPESRPFRNALMCIPKDTLQSLHIHDLIFRDVSTVASLLHRQAGSLTNIRMCFPCQSTRMSPSRARLEYVADES
ncbi:hypothetical protein NM688_g8113 [Phlebia brevispora]|uniref:Uncharacterized protein n=1 Tax=Phlebia brevispora TaxID=194682 RepID=A0ACC1RX42_9APHY|nr:hypothetical protein NM688_g8113 [Phlebia brevispora]